MLSDGTTQTAPTIDRSGRRSSRGMSPPYRGPATSTTSGSWPRSPAVPTWASTHPHSGHRGGAPAGRPAPRAGPARHAHLADVCGWTERRHHHRHIFSLTRSTQERGGQVRGLWRVKPQPVILDQEPHHRQSRPPRPVTVATLAGCPGSSRKPSTSNVGASMPTILRPQPWPRSNGRARSRPDAPRH
jgi:hypothetical protein